MNTQRQHSNRSTHQERCTFDYSRTHTGAGSSRNAIILYRAHGLFSSENEIILDFEMNPQRIVSKEQTLFDGEQFAREQLTANKTYTNI